MLGRNASLWIDPNIRIVDLGRRRRWDWVRSDHIPKDINGKLADTNVTAFYAEIDGIWINGRTLAVGGDLDQAMERADRTGKTAPDGRRSVQRLGRAVPSQPV